MSVMLLAEAQNCLPVGHVQCSYPQGVRGGQAVWLKVAPLSLEVQV